MHILQRVAVLAGIAAMFSGVLGCSQRGPEGGADPPPLGVSGAPIEFEAERPVEVLPLRGRTPASQNLLVNGDFSGEDGQPLQGWEVVDGTSAGVEPTGLEGARALAISESAEAAVVRQVVELVEGARYWLRGYVRTENIEGGARFVVLAPGHPGVFHEAGTEARGDTWWSPVSMEFEALLPEIEVQLTVDASPSGSGKAYFDAVELLRLDEPVPPNLLRNGSFEAPTFSEHWRKVEQFRVEPSTEAVHGTRSLKATVRSDTDLDVYQWVAVIPGETYRLSGMVKTQGASGPVQLEVRDAQRGWRGFIHSGEPIMESPDWIYLSTTFTVPSGTEALAVFLRRPPGEESEAGEVWFDGYRMSPTRN